MNFDLKYPNAPHMGEVEPGLFKSGIEEKCYISTCINMTSWIDMDFETTVCSEECRRRLVNDYVNAVRESGLSVYKEVK